MFGRSLTSRLVSVIAVVTAVCVFMVVAAVTWASYRTMSGAVTGRTAMAAAMFGFTAVVLASLVAWRLGRQLSKPVVVMAQTMRRMAEGDLDVVAPPTHAATELGDMAKALEAFRTNARERLEAEAGRRAAEKTAQDRSDFLAVMSHEIRTPMNGVIGMADALSHTNLTDSQREMLKVLTDSGDVLLGLLNDVLDYSKLESGKLAVQQVPLDVQAVVDETVSKFKAEASKKGVDLTVQGSDLEPALLGDPARVRQILQNLLSNAVKFTRAGRITVSFATEQVSLGACTVRISVEDTGIGIAPSLEARLFQKFVQADPSSTRAHDGAGLGLAISRELARLMGGDVTVASREGEGSTFTLEIVAERAPQTAAGDVGPDRTGGSSPTLRVLAVEGNPHNRQVLGILLEMANAQATYAEDAAGAVDLWSRGAFDMILMDSAADGLHAVQAVRERERKEGWTPIPIIGMTAKGTGRQREAALAAGMDAQVGKPIHPAALFEVIEQVLHRPTQAGGRKAA